MFSVVLVGAVFHISIALGTTVKHIQIHSNIQDVCIY